MNEIEHEYLVNYLSKMKLEEIMLHIKNLMNSKILTKGKVDEILERVLIKKHNND